MQKTNRQTLAVFWRHAMQYRLMVSIITIGIFVVIVCDTVKPLVYKQFFDTLFGTNVDKVDQATHYFWYIILLTLINQLVWRVICLANNYFQPRVMSDLLNTCFEYVQGHSYTFFTNHFVGSLVTRIRRYQGAFESIADQLCWNLIITGLRIVFIFAVLFYKLWILGIIMLIWTIIYLVFAYAYCTFKLKYDIAKAAQETRTTGYISDVLTNNLNIKLFVTEAIEIKIFHSITEKLFQLRKKSWDIGQYAELFQSISMVVLEFLLIRTGIHYWQKGWLTIGDLVMLTSYVRDMSHQLWDVGRSIRTIYEALADAEEMTQILYTPYEIVDEPDAQDLQVTEGCIEFQNVCVQYDGETDVLKNLNLTIRPGEHVGIVGPSGGGKSTITNVLTGLVKLKNGRILIDGQDISLVTQDSLRKNISLVSQNTQLFYRSLRDNIAYGCPDATDEEIIAASKAAQCHDFIQALSHGYAMLVGERGIKLSGGQRQRIAIARAILKNARISVLDEATSSLDSKAEYLIQDVLQGLIEGRTTICVAHRLSTIMNAHRILVVNEGQICEEGTHEELIQMPNGIYQKLWNIQAGAYDGLSIKL